MTSAGLLTRKALITFVPVRRATSMQNVGPSSPWSWTRVSSARSTAAAISSSVWLTKTPATSQRRFIAWPISWAASGSTRRALSEEWLSPIAQAPAETAASASSSRVIPQIFTFIVRDDGRSPQGRRARIVGLGQPGTSGRPVTELHVHLLLGCRRGSGRA